LENVTSRVLKDIYSHDRNDIEVLQNFHSISKLVHYIDTEHRTCLHYATFGASTSLIDILLSHGANIHAVENHGMTALHYACFLGNLRAVRALLRRGADPNVTEKKIRVQK